MLSRREMGALCASLLFCLLLSLGAGWAQSQLTTADQLAADTLRLHIRADTDSVRDQSAKLAVRDAVLALTDEACPANSRADARAWAAENLVRFELTARQTLAALGIRAPVKACLVNMYFPTRRYDGGALPAAAGRPELVVRALPGSLPVSLRRVRHACRKRPCLRGVYRPVPVRGVVGRPHRAPGGRGAGRVNRPSARRIG